MVKEKTDTAKKEEPATAPVKSEAAGAEKPKTDGRRSAIKEIIPMAWKLVGNSAGTPVTLLKSIEREEAESQLARLKQEGYYSNLQIYAIGKETPLSSTHEKTRKRVIAEALSNTERSKSEVRAAAAAKKSADNGAADEKKAKSTRTKTVKKTEVAVKKAAPPKAKTVAKKTVTAKKTATPKKKTTAPKTAKAAKKSTPASKKKAAKPAAKRKTAQKKK